MNFSKHLKWLALLWAATVMIYVYVGMKHSEGITNDMKWEAANGNPKAMYELGKRYNVKGEDDFDKGMDLIRRAAAKGYAPAQYDVANYHLLITQDTKEAYKWMTLASEQSYKDSASLKEAIVKDLSPSEIKSVETELQKIRSQIPPAASEKKS
jgi:TPR repeat protein